MEENSNTPRSRVSKEVLEHLTKSLQNGDLTIDQARKIASETLATLAEIEKHEEQVLDFYKKLADNYPTFVLLYTRIKGEVLKAREILEYEAALKAIENGNTKQAQEILKTAIADTANETAELK